MKLKHKPLIFLGLITLILLCCRAPLKGYDFWYSGRGEQVNTEISIENSIIDYGGCSGVVIGAKGTTSYVATAQHCVTRVKKFSHITKDNKSFLILRTFCDTEKDICVLEIEGLLPYVKPIKEKPNNSIDITIGYVSGQIVKLEGRAIPGQSGGAVVGDNKLWGVVSTTGQGVAIWPALERMELLWILEKN